MMEFVSWDDDIPNMMGKRKNVPNHQPDHNRSAYGNTNSYQRFTNLAKDLRQHLV